MKVRFPVAHVLLVVHLLAGTAHAARLDDILARKRLRIGVCEFVPWTFTNRDGALEGFDVDVARQVAQDMAVTPDFKMYDLEDVFGALGRGDIDVIAAGLAITPARALRVEFSAPYFQTGVTVVTHKSRAGHVESTDDLNQQGFVIVTVAETFSSSIASQLFDVATVKSVADGVAAEDEILSGRAQAYLTNLPDAQILVQRHPDTVAIPLAKPIIGSVAGLAVRRGDQELLNFLNAWIASRRADNWLQQTYGYWFSGYDWIQRAKR